MGKVAKVVDIGRLPVYAESDPVPEEYNPNEIYESPLNQSYGPIVNDYRPVKAADESEIFAEEAGRLTGRRVSGRDADNGIKPLQDLTISSMKKGQVSGGNDKQSNPVKDTVSAEKGIAVKKAEERAEKVLIQTDDSFESAPAIEQPGNEYQARRQMADLNALRHVSNSTPKTETLRPESFEQLSGMRHSAPQGIQNGTNSGQKLLEGKNSIVDKKNVNTQVTVVNNNADQNRSPKNPPLVISGDDAQYASDSGDFIIEGNVRLEQGETKLFSTKAAGNEKTGDIWLLEGGTMQEPTNTVRAVWAHYNFNKETGELLHLKGASTSTPGSAKKDYYEAPHGVIENGMLVIDQGGTTTRCPAVRHPSCLSVKAKTITIIPNDRIIAKGVQVFVKGKHIYSRDVWINDLQESRNRLMPHVGWDDDKGVYMALEYERPIGNPLLKNPTKFFMRQVYYTKSKYKPFYSIRHDEHDFYARLHHGYIYDSDNDNIDEGIWLKKKMDWGLFLKPHRIAKGIPLSYEAKYTHGLWQYSHRNWSSWHTEKAVYLRHDRFFPLGGKKLYVDLLAGRRWVNESNAATAGTRRHGKNLNSNVYRGTVGYRFSDKWNIWTTYHNEHKTSYNFSKWQPSFSKDWRFGISWRPDKHNAFTIVNRHNSDSDSRYHGNYSTIYRWVHKFCCEILSVSYTKKHYKHENEWTVQLEFLNW